MKNQKILTKPSYFCSIQQKSIARWNQLESDPELEGSWRQLFNQVQSPRHVLSELLQNADDAGATEANVWIKDGVFNFEHNGEDFNEENFASICRFGYSNKKFLHTIGFRGIGFKSIFSLGDRVEIRTPTLSVYFDRQRFTEPCWSPQEMYLNDKTCISVLIKDSYRMIELEKNLKEWQQNPLSLLFFKNIRRIRVDHSEVYWKKGGPGPVPDSEWMILGEEQNPRFLVVRSEGEPFPEDAMEEIRKEKNISSDENLIFPLANIDIVLGADGRLFVILPTGVQTTIPFACNAPFIQDPARLKIKDPETSPTNRWLLQRTGRLAATAMLGWLNQTEISHEKRAHAYGLLPNVTPQNDTLGEACRIIIKKSFEDIILDKNFVLTSHGSLVSAGKSITLPDPILETWSPEQAANMFDKKARFPISSSINLEYKNKLLDWKAIEEIHENEIINILQNQSLPRPGTWHQLLRLWKYILNTNIYFKIDPKKINIFPADQKCNLFKSSDLNRIENIKIMASEDNWKWLVNYILVFDNDWIEFLETLKNEEEPFINKIFSILKDVGLDKNTDFSNLIENFVKNLSKKEIVIEEWAQIAHLSAQLKINVKENFRYVTRDGRLRSPNEVLFDIDGTIETYIPEKYRNAIFLHPKYLQSFTLCTRDEWMHWAATTRSGLRPFPSPIKKNYIERGQEKIKSEIQNRGYSKYIHFPYAGSWFEIVDWDFDEFYWEHWQELAKSNIGIWYQIIKIILKKFKNIIESNQKVYIYQISQQNKKRSIIDEFLLPSWILKFREIRCLRDTQGNYRKPKELLRRTPQTESWINSVNFVCSECDEKEMEPFLDLLGVSSKPPGPELPLERLRALAQSGNPPMHEVEKLYRTLDQMLSNSYTRDDFNKIKETFYNEKIIRTDKKTWEKAISVFRIADDENFPGAMIIYNSISELDLWQKIGVTERPTAELAIQWLQKLPSEQKLSKDELYRVQKLIERHPIRIWKDCKHWLNLAGEWTKTSNILYNFTTRSSQRKNLHEWVKKKTADLLFMSKEKIGNMPFSEIPELDTCLEERLQHDLLSQEESEKKDWITTFGNELRRIELDDPHETDRVRALALRLAKTRWLRVQEIEIIPYLHGEPAGTPQRHDVLWQDHILYIKNLPDEKLAKIVPDEIGKIFKNDAIDAALKYSFDRSSDKVRAYLEMNFNFVSIDVLDNFEKIEKNQNNTFEASSMEENGNNKSKAPTTANTPLTELSPPLHTNSISNTISNEPRPSSEPRNRRQHEQAPTIMERFAVAQGFEKNKDGRFFHKNGLQIMKTSAEDVYPWVQKTASGDAVRYYFPQEHCLEKKSLEFDSEAWRLLEKYPEKYSIVLEDISGNPIERTGSYLCALKDNKELDLHPASYRLVLKGRKNA